MTDTLPQAKGGEARAKSLSREQRSDIAKRAAVARWSAHLPDATHEGELEIAGLNLPVAVTSDGTRLMISKAFMTALGRPWKGSYAHTELPNFISAKNLLPFVTDELRSVLDPVEFINTRGQKAQGYRAELLPLVCDVYLDKRLLHLLPTHALTDHRKYFFHVPVICWFIFLGNSHLGCHTGKHTFHLGIHCVDHFRCIGQFK